HPQPEPHPMTTERNTSPESVVLHACGYRAMRRRGVIGWRTHYCAAPGSAAEAACDEAVERGWMVAGRRHPTGEYPYATYYVTRAGLEWASARTGRSIDHEGWEGANG